MDLRTLAAREFAALVKEVAVDHKKPIDAEEKKKEDTSALKVAASLTPAEVLVKRFDLYLADKGQGKGTIDAMDKRVDWSQSLNLGVSPPTLATNPASSSPEQQKDELTTNGKSPAGAGVKQHQRQRQ